ncbi:MAG: helix-turn-helix domain-containing protein [Myxococcota bacterium]
MSAPKYNDPAFKKEIDELVVKLMTTQRPWSMRRARREFERSYAEYMIRRSGGERQRAAKRLDIGFSTLKEKIRREKVRRR